MNALREFGPGAWIMSRGQGPMDLLVILAYALFFFQPNASNATLLARAQRKNAFMFNTNTSV
eukprot:6469025-Amphidinium_carterae.1